MKNENSQLMESLKEILVNPSKGRLEIAQLLSQNGIDISDKDFDEITKISKEEQTDFKEVAYELSDDKKKFATVDMEVVPKVIKKTFVQIPTKEEARFLEDIFYQTQDRRIAIAGQIRSIKQEADSKSNDKDKNNDNMSFLEWYYNQMVTMEANIKMALEAFSDSFYIARWAKANKGIGPIIATCLAANLEVEEGMHAGNWWSYCGLNDNNRPWLGKEKSKAIVEECIKENGGILDDNVIAAISVKTKWKIDYLREKAYDEKKGWKKDELIKACSFIPYNRGLKVLMYKIGHSFRLCKNKPDSLYGRILREREDYENAKNAAGDYAEQAYEKAKLVGKTTVAYKHYSKGQLPPAHIAQRCERYAAKLFISHLFEAAWWNKFGTDCPEPYIIGYGENHDDYIKPEVDYKKFKRDSDK